MPTAPPTALAGELAVVVAIALSHMSMPTHWLPYFLVGTAQRWGLRRTLAVTFAGAAGHAFSTIAVIAALSGLGGAALSHETYRAISCLLLLAAGAYYLQSYFYRARRDACCAPGGKERAVDGAAALSLVAVTTLSPCVGSMPVLLAVLKPPLTAGRVLAAFGALLGASAGAMCALVAVAFLGAARLEFAAWRRHERLVMGVSFLVLAIVSYRMGGTHVHVHAADAVVRRQVTVNGKAQHRGCH